MRAYWIFLLPCFLGCSETISHSLDSAELPDSGGAEDAIALDTGGPDAGSQDAGPGDLGSPDLGAPDLGVGPDDASISDVDVGRGNIEVWVRGDLTPKTFNDGLSGQTPEAQTFSLGRFDLMRSANDTSPVVAFDHGDHPVAADMLGRTLVGRVASASIAPGTYTWGRVLLTSAEIRIQATGHLPNIGIGIPGTITTLGALSDSEIHGSRWHKGQAEFRFDSGGRSFTLPGTLPPFPSTPGGSIVETSTQTWLVFPFSTPFRVEAGNNQPVVTTIVYDVYQSFRWADQNTAGYAAGVFDVDGAAMSTEPIHSVGATNYRTEP
ncbi:MAG: hypothetical protein U1E65_20880 [Myxococcota bacterium]